MSLKHPECPLYNHLNCKEYYNPRLCALVRKEKICLKKKKVKTKSKENFETRKNCLEEDNYHITSDLDANNII